MPKALKKNVTFQIALVLWMASMLGYFHHPELVHTSLTITVTNSQVLIGTADLNYEFIYFNSGTNGRISDGGVLEYIGF
jgi:hypothetical protein